MAVLPGILVLNSTLHLKFMNQQAVSLAGCVNSAQKGVQANGVIPNEVLALATEVLTILLSRNDAKAWEDFQVQTLVTTPQNPILLSGFGLPDPAGIQHSHVLIFLEEVPLNKEASLEEVQLRYHLTVRELQVVRVLCKGLTNKEIAADLDIAEQTVKEHVKNIMVKTHTNTRTGILALALRAASEVSPDILSHGSSRNGLRPHSNEEKPQTQQERSPDKNGDEHEVHRRDQVPPKVRCAA